MSRTLPPFPEFPSAHPVTPLFPAIFGMRRARSPSRSPSVLAAAVLVVAHAQNYPTKPVKMVVPFPPGGSLDIAGRLIAQKLTDAWGQRWL